MDRIALAKLRQQAVLAGLGGNQTRRGGKFEKLIEFRVQPGAQAAIGLRIEQARMKVDRGHPLDGFDRGKVVEIHANPASELLVLDDETLVPVNFVISVQEDAITVETPKGIFPD